MEQKSLLTMQVKYTCGCGFHSTKEDAAIHHATQRAHTLTIHGVVCPPAPKQQVFVQKREY